MKKISIIGAGSFGTAIAVVLGHSGYSISIWAREKEVVDGINQDGYNPEYISDVELPKSVSASYAIKDAVMESEMVVFATPSHALREVAGKAKAHLTGNEIIVSVAKGIEQDSLMTPSQILVDVLEGAVLEDQIGILTGPSHAEEVSKFKPTAITASAYSKRAARIIQETFMTPMFRVYLNYDILGAEIGGALKNIMAIAAGIIDGAELGDNAKAALMTRGLHEMKRMGCALGASQDTFSGLTGMGDLIVTCTSEHSRNRYVGYNIGQGKSLQEITSGMNMIAEGVKTAKSVTQWSRRNNIEMPITDAVYKVLFENMDPKDAVNELMTRNAKDEIMI
ncbi:NAD(P)H-dependent glycerol-3-phosphate dehydrogenase [Rhodohalobacter sulfatireducens]|uniref:Glycerol-3-phosphate dehydrogenase [NAD(P)+] n=1 Tax=Rhodohalobacter sulfatireducens TaxID=2911366 RepID=A0ABS9K891_9BACT|nr:NAD(P)H-dependent glycerol-3-phosphate dehydrogenase [Rhodohalobacter sulfatireducens]MDR9363948.1 NAD(P)H-dependent glycerol-3-phosphate dehydrogenase [Balneolaceae bacterium]MDR9407965.1 NAD(P)H-dependent glycerol-3-phosphate dehydrogenase [Balneolaceae bacterium]